MVPILTKLVLNLKSVCCGPNIKDMGLFKMVFSTKGSFVKDARLRYDGRDVYALSGQYTYFFSFFEACDLIKGMGSSFNIDDVKLSRKHENGCLEKDIKPFINDEDATLLDLYAEKSSCGVEIYIEQRLSSVEMDMEHVMDVDYMTDELDSGADDDSCVDGHAVIRFNEEETLRKHFIFKMGMEFSSLKKFKKVVLEHCVLNGREVRVIVEKLKNNSGMKLNEVVADLRLRFAIEIIESRAFKARQLARKVVEGDSAKQYSIIWSYDAELRRESKGNTLKLNIIGLPPWFERFYICFYGTSAGIEEEYPEFEHMFYLRNLYANFKKKFGGGTLYRDLVMAATKETFYEAHEDKMNQIKEVSLDAFEWINVIPKHKVTPSQPEVTPSQHEVTPSQPKVIHATQFSVSFVEAMKMYSGIDHDELAAFLNDDA
ncbi:hypothetical protein KIW84_062270 [Lathyrus oleraceus]|uniref:Uncharacterized protein n=1 Tax=Pisum sativum TaxID=3888 RepID=A0A9D5A5L6_PEA|nr:hypothetical protein KIW84_062270 [Pisum sativum]